LPTYLLKRLTKKQRQAPPGEMSGEAAAFVYLAEGTKEIRD
jgi:hypothetical protein